MFQTDIHKRKTDQAWKQLYTRLEQDGLLTDTPTKRLSITGRKEVVGWVASAAALCIALISVFHLLWPEDKGHGLLTMHNTEDATTLITTLEDGSIVYLAEKAALYYPKRFEVEKRQVVLEGNAEFDISGNKERPFCIETQEVEIEVLGTSFHVRNDKYSPFELTVTHGVVKVTTKDGQKSSLVRAGEQIRLLPDGLELRKIDTDDPEAKTFSRYLRFKDQKLGDVLRVLNKRMVGTPLTIDPALADKSLTVAFDNLTSPDEAADVICAGLNLRHVKENGTIKLTN